MAVVTLKYIRARKQIKAHIRYITHRAGRDGEKITRTLFNAAGLTDKQASYKMIDNAKRGTVFFKFMISPAPFKEDTYKDLDLQLVTRNTLLSLEKQLGRRFQFVATIHNDHTDKRHVHGIFLLPGRLTREEFRMLSQTARFAATQDALLQRKTHNLWRTHPRYLHLTAFIRSVSAQSRGVRFSRLQGGCPSCGYGQLTGIPISLSFCPMCRTPLKKEQKLSLEREAHS